MARLYHGIPAISTPDTGHIYWLCGHRVIKSLSGYLWAVGIFTRWPQRLVFVWHGFNGALSARMDSTDHSGAAVIMSKYVIQGSWKEEKRKIIPLSAVCKLSAMWTLWEGPGSVTGRSDSADSARNPHVTRGLQTQLGTGTCTTWTSNNGPGLLLESTLLMILLVRPGYYWDGNLSAQNFLISTLQYVVVVGMIMGGGGGLVPHLWEKCTCWILPGMLEMDNTGWSNEYRAITAGKNFCMLCT